MTQANDNRRYVFTIIFDTDGTHEIEKTFEFKGQPPSLLAEQEAERIVQCGFWMSDDENVFPRVLIAPHRIREITFDLIE
jgi:hypothetical protein